MIGFSRMTPWVGRLIIANAVVHLLRLTVFTAPGVVETLAFDPAAGLARPWTFLSYMFIHHDLVHLAVNMLGLYVFGTAVEQRLTSRVFLPFYLFCGVGAALLTLLVAPMLPIAPFIGASGAVMGGSGAKTHGGGSDGSSGRQCGAGGADVVCGGANGGGGYKTSGGGGSSISSSANGFCGSSAGG